MTDPERERFEILVTAAVDGELDAAGRRELEALLDHNPALRREMDDQMHIKEVVGTLRFVEPPEEVWDQYRRAVLFRLERRFGWILFLVGAGSLVGYGGWVALSQLWESTVSFWVKGGVFAALGGSAVLLASIVRERLTLRRRERYDEVIR